MAGMTMIIECPGCNHSGPHDLTSEHFDDEGFLIGYTTHCRKCENVWLEEI